MSASTTSAPSAARRAAIARPMPRPAPVTMAVFPCSFIGAPPPAASEQGGLPRTGRLEQSSIERPALRVQRQPPAGDGKSLLDERRVFAGPALPQSPARIVVFSASHLMNEAEDVLRFERIGGLQPVLANG